MNEHEDDIEPEVEEGVDFEVEEFPVLAEDEEDEEDEEYGDDGRENEEADAEPDIDPDASEL